MMRVKLVIALAIASVLILCSAGAAMASIIPDGITGVPTSSDLQNAAMTQTTGDDFSVPNTDAINGDTVADDQDVLDSCLDSCGLQNPICGCNGGCPAATCTETDTEIPGPNVNLACPVVNTVSVPVCLETPQISPTFPSICLAPEATVALPQVNANLNCYDINCGSCCANPCGCD